MEYNDYGQILSIDKNGNEYHDDEFTGIVINTKNQTIKVFITEFGMSCCEEYKVVIL